MHQVAVPQQQHVPASTHVCQHMSDLCYGLDSFCAWGSADWDGHLTTWVGVLCAGTCRGSGEVCMPAWARR